MPDGLARYLAGPTTGLARLVKVSAVLTRERDVAVDRPMAYDAGLVAPIAGAVANLIDRSAEGPRSMGNLPCGGIRGDRVRS